MSLRNTTTTYGSMSKWLHWITALLIIGMLIFGTILVTLIDDKALKSLLFLIHKSTGVLILVLIVLRWIWRQFNPAPQILSYKPPMTKFVTWFHELTYLAVFLMLLSGLLMTATGHKPIPFYGLFSIQTTGFTDNRLLHETSVTLHLVFAWILAAMITIHAVAALKHHFYNKDDTLRRMI